MIPNVINFRQNSVLRDGVQGLIFWEHDFEIGSDPKGTQRGPNFWSGFEAPDP